MTDHTPVGTIQSVCTGISVVEHPVRFWGLRFRTRMTLIQMSQASLCIHSPVPQSAAIKDFIQQIQPRRIFLVAPNTLHHLFIGEYMRSWPQATVIAAHGLGRKRRDLALASGKDFNETDWPTELQAITIQGNSYLNEIVLYHRSSKTLIVTDLIENFTSQSPGLGWETRWMAKLSGMWNRPSPSPEFRLYSHKKALAAALRQVLALDFERIILAHGDLIESTPRRTAKDCLRTAYEHVLH
ncbi:MAG: DUF4336 domain-containing protein [Leptospiraceae bacterium]|nr:DUF4336 domain-containing protein [Leptospiraceae bacterium]